MFTSNSRVRVFALIALVVLLAAGAATVHAQCVYTQVQLHPAGDIEVIYTRFGPRTIVVPCVHWVAQCL